MSIQLVVSDIDGTILDDHQRIGERLVAAAKALDSRGISFVLASARAPMGMAGIAEELGLSHHPLAAYNGALILTEAHSETADVLASHCLPKEEVLAFLQELKANWPQLSPQLYSYDQWYAQVHDEWTIEEERITSLKAQVTDLIDLVEAGKEVHKILVIGQAETVQTMMAAAKQMTFPTLTFGLSKPNYLEVTHHVVSKEHALKELAAYFHIPLSDTLAIGDNFNDLPMIRLAGCGVAMKNAPEEVRQQAPHVTETNENDGVAIALERFVLEK